MSAPKSILKGKDTGKKINDSHVSFNSTGAGIQDSIQSVMDVSRFDKPRTRSASKNDATMDNNNVFF